MYMTFPYNEHLELAKELSKTDKPAYLRSAISRAYYAVYIKACYVANEHNRKDRSSHQAISDKYKKHDDPDAQVIGEVLADLRKKRNEADYDGACDIKGKDATYCIEKAEEYIKLLKELEDQIVF